MSTTPTTDLSRNLVSEHKQDGKYSIDILQLSASLRIADATEKMATNYGQMQKDLAWYMKAYHEQQAKVDRLNGTIRNLKGQITKAKNAAK